VREMVAGPSGICTLVGDSSQLIVSFTTVELNGPESRASRGVHESDGITFP